MMALRTIVTVAVGITPVRRSSSREGLRCACHVDRQRVGASFALVRGRRRSTLRELIPLADRGTGDVGRALLVPERCRWRWAFAVGDVITKRQVRTGSDWCSRVVGPRAESAGADAVRSPAVRGTARRHDGSAWLRRDRFAHVLVPAAAGAARGRSTSRMAPGARLFQRGCGRLVDDPVPTGAGRRSWRPLDGSGAGTQGPGSVRSAGSGRDRAHSGTEARSVHLTRDGNARIAPVRATGPVDDQWLAVAGGVHRRRQRLLAGPRLPPARRARRHRRRDHGGRCCCTARSPATCLGHRFPRREVRRDPGAAAPGRPLGWARPCRRFTAQPTPATAVRCAGHDPPGGGRAIAAMDGDRSHFHPLRPPVTPRSPILAGWATDPVRAASVDGASQAGRFTGWRSDPDGVGCQRCVWPAVVAVG